MNINEFIHVEDNLISPTIVAQIIRYANTVSYDVGTTIGDRNPETVKTIRNTETFPLYSLSPSLTNAHWANLLIHYFRIAFDNYKKKFPYVDYKRILDLSILKYETGGFYNFHIDHAEAIPRTLSVIILLNNDYEGGNLTFLDQASKQEKIIENKVGRLILWPSNFIYPHCVTPVTKGTRYSIVLWAL